MSQQSSLRRDQITVKYRNGAAFNKHAAQMQQAGWQIGPHTERGKKASVVWFRDVPASVPPKAFLPTPPRSGLPLIRIIGMAVAVLVVLLIIGAAISGTNATANKNAVATRVVTLSDGDYQAVDVRDLKKNPDAYKGKPIQLQGEVFNIKEQSGQTFLQMWVPIPGGTQFDREAVVVNYGGALPNVYEKTKITVFGIGDGTGSGKNAFGATSTQPAIHADRVIA